MQATMQFVSDDYLDHTPNNHALPNLAFMRRVTEEHDTLQALLLWLGHCGPSQRWTQQEALVLLSEALTSLDEKINAQLNSILHHPKLKALEANWRGALMLAEQAGHSDREEQVNIKLLNLSWNDLSQDLHRAIEFDQSQLFAKIYSAEFGSPGGEPIGLLLGAYDISHRQAGGEKNINTLKELTRVAAAAFAPIVLNAEPSFFGVNHYTELTGVTTLDKHFDSPELASWRSLRNMEESRFLALALPKILMRAPHLTNGQGPEPFKFHEQQNHSEHDFLWGPACFGVGCVAIRAFAQSGWFAQIRGYRAGHIAHGIIDNLPNIQTITPSAKLYPLRSAVNWQVSDQMEKQLTDEGFLAVQALANTDMLFMASTPSVQQAKTYDQPGAQISAQLSAMLHYTLCVSRFAHYLKIMGRDRIGGYRTPGECESQLQSWLHSYTMASEGNTDETRARFPLRQAKVSVKERAGSPGHYYSVIQLQPHFQLDQMVTGIRLVTELTPLNEH